jgi:hypothetical protein
MHFGCYCGTGFELGPRDRKSMIDGIDQFCSSACLVKFLRETGDSSRLKDIIVKTRENVLYNKQGIYDRDRDIWFRSGYELTVANFFDQRSFPWRYEIRIVIFRDTVTYYTPDFLLPNHGYLVEVKGLWLKNSKKKFIKASKILPMILIPDYLVKDIKRNALHSY